MKKEVKIGLIIVLSLAALIWGVNFLKGKNFFKSTKSYVVIYDDVSGLLKANGVFIKGYKVGSVDNIGFSDESMTQLRVVLTIKDDVKIPKGSRARIYNLDLIGNKAVELIFSNKKEYYKENDTISGEVEVTLAKMLEPYKDQANRLLAGLDSLSVSFLNILDPQNQQNFKSSLRNIEKLTAALSVGSEAMISTMQNTSEFTDNLNENNKKINELLANLQQLSKNLNQINYAASFEKLDNTLEESSQILTSIRSGNGTLGQLITNDTLYYNLNKASLRLDSLIEDIKARPRRYLHISVFGRRDK